MRNLIRRIVNGLLRRPVYTPAFNRVEIRSALRSLRNAGS